MVNLPSRYPDTNIYRYPMNSDIIRLVLLAILVRYNHNYNININLNIVSKRKLTLTMQYITILKLLEIISYYHK